MVVRHLSDLNDDGTTLGQSSTDLISLWGVTPAVQPSGSAQAAVTTATIAAVTTITPTLTAYGFTLTQATAVLTAINDLVTRVNSNSALLNAIRSAAVTSGLMKGSA